MGSGDKKPWKIAAGIMIALVIGFAAAMLYMALKIYVGYCDAYRAEISACTVKGFGMDIYRIMPSSDGYCGESIGTNMGIVCGICMAAAVLLEGAVWQLCRRKGR